MVLILVSLYYFCRTLSCFISFSFLRCFQTFAEAGYRRPEKWHVLNTIRIFQWDCLETYGKVWQMMDLSIYQCLFERDLSCGIGVLKALKHCGTLNGEGLEALKHWVGRAQAMPGPSVPSCRKLRSKGRASILWVLRSSEKFWDLRPSFWWSDCVWWARPWSLRGAVPCCACGVSQCWTVRGGDWLGLWGKEGCWLSGWPNPVASEKQLRATQNGAQGWILRSFLSHQCFIQIISDHMQRYAKLRDEMSCPYVLFLSFLCRVLNSLEACWKRRWDCQTDSSGLLMLCQWRGWRNPLRRRFLSFLDEELQ